jgi:transcriptional regulator with XRE-family HTH domain
MGYYTTEERVRARIAGLVRHGDAVKIADYSAQRRAPRPGLSAQNLSYFLNGRRKRPLGINDLEDIALYFNLTVGELFTVNKKTELTGPEQRLLLAYAAAPPAAQAAALTPARIDRSRRRAPGRAPPPVCRRPRGRHAGHHPPEPSVARPYGHGLTSHRPGAHVNPQ